MLYKLKRSKTTLQRKLTDRGYVKCKNEIVCYKSIVIFNQELVPCIQCRLVEYELRKEQSDLVQNEHYQSKLYNLYVYCLSGLMAILYALQALGTYA